MIYYVEGPHSSPYMVEAENEQEALDKCYDYEFETYDLWASAGFNEDGEWYEDYFAMEDDFKIISFAQFNEFPKYNDLVNYPFKYKNDVSDFCEIKNNPCYNSNGD